MIIETSGGNDYITFERRSNRAIEITEISINTEKEEQARANIGKGLIGQLIDSLQSLVPFRLFIITPRSTGFYDTVEGFSLIAILPEFYPGNVDGAVYGRMVS